MKRYVLSQESCLECRLVLYTYALPNALILLHKLTNKLAVNYTQWFNNYSLQQGCQLIITYTLALTAIVPLFVHCNSVGTGCLQTQMYRLAQNKGSTIQYCFLKTIFELKVRDSKDEK